MQDKPIQTRMPAALLCGLLCGLFLAAPLTARAAEISIHDPALRDAAGLISGTCSVRLKGAIEPGDAGRLEAEMEARIEDGSLEQTRPTGLNFGIAAEGHVLCLDSLGGDAGEALALARVIRDHALATAVPDGAQCIGPCAVAFMAGSVASSNSDGGARMPMRALHTGGRLGFLAPQTADGDAALDYIAGLTDLFSGIDSYTPTARLHPQLMVEMLLHRDPAHPYMIDTTGKAGLYDIRLAGVPQIETDEATWMRGCNNLSLQARGWQSATDPDLSSWSWQVNLPEDGYSPEARLPPDGWDLPVGGADAIEPPFFREVLSRHHQCLFYHDAAATPPYAAWFERVSEDAMPQLRLFDLWQTLPHYTPLAELRAMERVEPADFRTLYADPPVTGPHPDLPAASGFTPGQSGVFEGEHGPLALWLGPDGQGRAYAAGEPAEDLSYRIAAEELCLTRGDAAETCGRLVSGEDSGVTLTIGGDDLRLRWTRPGDIGPLLAR